MSLILEDASGRELQVNVWSWGVLHHQVAVAEVLPHARWAPKRGNAGGDLDAHEVKRLADFLEREVAPRMDPGERMFFDGSVTDEPDDGTFFREPADMWRNYSLHRSVLDEIVGFLREATGPVAFY